jgi:hypothetical protein
LASRDRDIFRGEASHTGPASRVESRDPQVVTCNPKHRGPDTADSSRRLASWVEQLLLTLVRPGNRRRGSRPVQTEMQFESLKVARNELTTADVEVVIKIPPRREPLSTDCRRRVLRLWWEEGMRRFRRLSANLF